MKIKLGSREFNPTGLQIVGVVLSILWAMLASWHTHSDDVAKAENFAKFSYEVCFDNKHLAHNNDLSNCDREREQNYKLFMVGDTGNTLLSAFVPVPFFWLAGFCLLYFTRAQIVGFRAVIPWSTLSIPRKAFVVFCVAMVTLSMASIIVDYMIASTDSKVPVSPTLKSFINQPGDYPIVEVVGTWVRTDLSDDTIADPIQTSRIRCIKSDNRCYEAKGYLGGTTLFSDLNVYDDITWTDNSIVIRSESMCAIEIYTIDLNTEVVSGAGHRTNQDKVYCQSLLDKDNPDKWTLQMEDGFKVYWQQRQKARPFFLRVFQSLFGN